MTWSTLTTEQFTRLAECRSRMGDIVPIARAYMTERNYSAENALVATLDHLDANGQYFDLTTDEWSECISQLERSTL